MRLFSPIPLSLSILWLVSACAAAPPPCVTPLPDPATGAVHPVAGQLAAYNDRHIDLFVSYFHPEVELFVQGETAPFLKGQAALRETYSAMFKVSPRLNCVVARRIVAGDFVIDEERVTGLRDGPPVHAVAIYELRHGKIVRAWFLRGR